MKKAIESTVETVVLVYRANRVSEPLIVAAAEPASGAPNPPQAEGGMVGELVTVRVAVGVMRAEQRARMLYVFKPAEKP
jgi:hypothetical protein